MRRPLNPTLASHRPSNSSWIAHTIQRYAAPGSLPPLQPKRRSKRKDVCNLVRAPRWSNYSFYTIELTITEPLLADDLCHSKNGDCAGCLSIQVRLKMAVILLSQLSSLTAPASYVMILIDDHTYWKYLRDAATVMMLNNACLATAIIQKWRIASVPYGWRKQNNASKVRGSILTLFLPVFNSGSAIGGRNVELSQFCSVSLTPSIWRLSWCINESKYIFRCLCCGYGMRWMFQAALLYLVSKRKVMHARWIFWHRSISCG